MKFVTKTLQGDTYTPIGIYTSLQGRNKMLFESNAKYAESGRYSFIAVDPIGELTGDGQASIFNGEVKNIAVAERLKEVLPIHQGSYPFAFFGGAIGYFSYETAFHFETIGQPVNDAYQLPDIHLYLYDTFIVMDHIEQIVTLVAVDLFGERTEIQMEQAIEGFKQQIEQQVTQMTDTNVDIQFSATISEEQFTKMVETAQQHIQRGDIFQVVLSQTFEASFEGDAFTLYRKLRATNPSPYMFYMNFDNAIVLGTSPESLVKVQQGVVTTNPIAGTKPRGATMEEDEQLAKSLLNDEKELAEHRMLVDLGRNDIGRVCEVGSVQVKRYMQIEKYKYVMHIVSEVTGQLKEDAHIVDVLAACLPAGTVSGAPKIRAMQIIHTLEQKKRGIYAGAVGYISASGNMDLTLAIRTMIVKEGKAYVQAGAGIVYDSIPRMEYEETLNKARALLEVRK
ncbi:anthranilate synthase component I [Metasolibacillus sp.]|uniref:anthranilate synthase component I n=1 Tax=Metasolibacillus sp. TaxID=2703680 RepID=UPI0025DC8ACA|nr:anthranilate synthase component I [Metasolibacillus sp.]MCT6922626.1 anthranilate synthase component I [Metasolibacillus sp.]MCT6939035.1 anthranilate synthase component I [Metasolibacillus sp.]